MFVAGTVLDVILKVLTKTLMQPKNAEMKVCIRILSCGTRDTASGCNVKQTSGRKSTVIAIADESGSHSCNQRLQEW